MHEDDAGSQMACRQIFEIGPVLNLELQPFQSIGWLFTTFGFEQLAQ
jgi:hypothetical protein